MMTRLALGARGETTCYTETGEAPAWQGATRAPLGHRRPRSNAAHAGCGAGRRQQGFRHGLLGLLGCLGAACGAPEPAAPPAETAAPDTGAGTILRVDPRFDALVPADARIEKLAEGYVFTEGPVWDRRESRLLFSDVRGNGVYQWSEADGTRPVIEPVFEGDRTGLRSVSSNGLTLDAEGRLVLCEHGNRRISRVEADGTRTTLVDSYEGRRLNSPNDAAYASNGWLYFTDPGSALEGRDASPLRELDFNGIYRLSPDGDLELLYMDQARPNGIALSPDETTLYVANSDPEQKVWMAYDLGEDGVSNPRVFFDVNDQTGEGAADGLKVDNAGNLFATGPGGVWVIAPDGAHLGTIMPDEVPANVAWGDDGRTHRALSDPADHRGPDSGTVDIAHRAHRGAASPKHHPRMCAPRA